MSRGGERFPRNSHLSKPIRLLLEDERLERLAREQGYETLDKMLYELYVVQRISIEQIRQRMLTSIWTLRRRFKRIGLEVKRGGARKRETTITFTKELFDELCRDGISAVAARLGLERDAFRAQLQRWEKNQRLEPEDDEH